MNYLLKFNEGMFDIEPFDQQIVQSILDLNNSQEFIDSGISLSPHEMERPLKIGVGDIIGPNRGRAQKLKNLYFFRINYRNPPVGVVSKRLLAIYRVPDNGGYGYSLAFNNVENYLENTPNAFNIVSRENLQPQASRNIISWYQYSLRQQVELEVKNRRDAETRAEKQRAALELKSRKEKAALESKLKKEKEIADLKASKEKAAADLKKAQDDFLGKYNTQMILDQFSNVFDLCLDHKILEEINLNTTIVRIILYFNDISPSGRSDDPRTFIKMTELSNNILSELMSVSERLLEKNIITTYSPFISATNSTQARRGITVKLKIDNPFIKLPPASKKMR